LPEDKIKKHALIIKPVLGSNFISIDSTSTAQLNAIQFQPHLSYDTALDTVYKLDVRIPKESSRLY
jgi:hypothetical protein